MLNNLSVVIRYIETHWSWPDISLNELSSLIIFTFFIALAVIESRRPRQKWSLPSLRQSYQANVGLFLFNSTLLTLISVPALLQLAEHHRHHGVLNWIPNPIVRAVLSFILLDLIVYLWHKASHSFDRLWLFHRVHHSDPVLNVSTAFRVHLIELLIMTGIKAAYILTLGIELIMVIVYETLMMLCVMFHHTNITFRGERWLGRLIMMPYLHRVHHSKQRDEHDSNYGAVLVIWDRLFGTLVELEPVEIGIKGHSPQTLLSLVKLGFVDTPRSVAVPAYPDGNIQAMIAEAAYYKAEKRAFFPGAELIDWLEAETEILKQLHQLTTEPEAVKTPKRPRIGRMDFIGSGLKLNRPVLN